MKLFLLLFLIASPLAFNQNTITYPVQKDVLKESIFRGHEIYKSLCISCHLANGEGVKDIYPPLAKSDYLFNHRAETISAIKFGIHGEISVNGKIYNNTMSALGLSNEEVADVMNYITNSWGNKNNEIITEKEVSQLKK